MLHCTRFLSSGDYRTSLKIADEFNNVLLRTGWGFDHVAIDVGTLAGAAGRYTRDLVGMERDAESVKILHRQITGVILRRIQPRKSLAIFLDGSEPLWKVRHMRLYPGKKFEGKFYRSAASPMVYLLEEKLKHAAVDLRSPPREFVVSGPTVPGPVEGKLSAWMLDLATRALPEAARHSSASSSFSSSSSSCASQVLRTRGGGPNAHTSTPPFGTSTSTMPSGPADVTRNDSICLIGGTDLFLSALGATPFHNLTTVTLQQGELKSLSLSESLEWLVMDHLLKAEAAANLSVGEGDIHKRLAAVRTDVVLLYLLTNGISATELTALGLSFKDAMEAYTAEEAAHGSKAHLFEESGKESTLRLRPWALERVLTRAVRRSSTAPARPCRQSADYLEILLQSHAMVCCGGIRNYCWTPDDNDVVPEKMTKPLADAFIGHLRHISATRSHCGEVDKRTQTSPSAVSNTNATDTGLEANTAEEPSGTIAASVDQTFALTGLETLLVSAPKAEMMEQIVPVFTKGHTLPAGVAAGIVSTRNVWKAIEKARSVLQGVANESQPHPAASHGPTHYFSRAPGSRGPPPGWAYTSVNLGIKAEVLNVRYRLGAGGETTADGMNTAPRFVDTAGVSARNTLFVFSTTNETPDEKNNGADPDLSGNTNHKCGTVENNRNDDSNPSKEKSTHGALPSVARWCEVPCDKLRTNAGEEELSTLRVVTWNVQFNRHSGERTPLGRPGIDWCTSTRYVALAKSLESLDADVIAMQEVEPSWWAFLASQPWVQTHYAISCGEESHAIRPWGVMLLVHRRLKVGSTQHANVPAFSGHTSVMPEVTLTVSRSVPVTVGSMHLLAPYNQNNINNRTTQLDNLTRRMRTRPVGVGAIVMGDFNDSAKSYFAFPSELGFKDAWSLLHGEEGEDGYTINGKRNTYASQIIEREFFGRADRVLFASRHLQPIHAELIGTKSVRELGIIRQVDSEKEVPEYLFPSDHFGLLVEFQVV